MNQRVSFPFLYFSKYFRLCFFKFINIHFNLFLLLFIYLFILDASKMLRRQRAHGLCISPCFFSFHRLHSSNVKGEKAGEVCFKSKAKLE